MKCLIKIDENGNAVDHPILLNNFLFAFPDIDITGDIAPSGFAWFTRKNKEEHHYTKTLKQVLESSYTKSDDGINYEDNHEIRDMTEEELNELYAQYPEVNSDGWTFDREVVGYIPPIPRPMNIPGYNSYEWDKETMSWKHILIRDLVSNTNTYTASTDQPAVFPLVYSEDNVRANT